jgi:KipI family sensor histidine kinase inhibitor
MNFMDRSHPNYQAVGESALLFELSDEMCPVVNDRVRALDSRMQEMPLAGVVEWIPAYASLMVKYDPQLIQLKSVKKWINDCLESTSEETKQEERCVVIPVRYGGEDGPDLEAVAAFHHLSPSEVIFKHTGATYRVAMMGFTPGFAYLAGLDPDIATPRQESPRIHVPAGSVGIAGEQTGVYPLDSPGGWQLIGRTDRTLFNPDQDQPFLLSPGDIVRFTAVDKRGDP